MLQLQIETIGGYCSAKCNFCPLTDHANYDRPKGVMSLELFQQIIDEAATIPQITQLCLTGLSETLLDKHLEDRIWYARGKMPSVFIDFYTNGLSLTPERFEKVRNAGVSCISVSINAVNAGQHDKIMHMGPKTYEKVVKNTKSAIKAREKCNIQVKAVYDGADFLESDLLEFYEQWGHRDYGGFGQVISAGNWAGTMPTVREVDHKSACGRALGQFYVLWDGLVTMCCQDPLGNHKIFGDLKKQTIKEIYNSSDYVTFREDHDQGRADKYSACAVCTRI